MYIKSANIFGFGKLVDKKFDFHQDYQVIRGLNESGKTTLLAFIKAILFEFESGKNKYEQYIPKNASKYGGELVLVEDGNEWLIRRVKGKTVAGDVSIYINGVQFPESSLTDLLKNINKQLFNSTYVLNQKNFSSLDHVKRDILIEDILTVGAVGGTEWLQLVKQLEKDAGNIYRSSKNAKKPLNLALKDYDNLVKQQTELNNQKTEYFNKQEHFEQVSQESQRLKKKYEELSDKLKQQQSILSKKNDYEEYLQLNQELSIQGNQTITNEDWDKFTSIDEQLKSVKKTLSSSKMALSTLNESEEVQLNNFNSNKNAIEKIQNELDSIGRREFNVGQLKKEITSLENEKNRILATNPMLADNMTPLTEDESIEVNAILKQSDTSQETTNLYTMIGAGVVSVVSLFLPGIMKAIAIIAFIIAIFFGYKYFLAKKEKSGSALAEYWARHYYQDLTIDQVIMWQPQITQLQNTIYKLKEIKGSYSSEEHDLNLWEKQVNDLNIVDTINVKNVRSYFEQINYLQKKQQDFKKINLQMDIKIDELSKKSIELIQQQEALLIKYQVNSAEEFIQRRSVDLQFQDQIKRRDVLKETLNTELLTEISEDPTAFDRLTKELELQQDRLMEIKSALNKDNNQLAELQVEIKNLANDDYYLHLEKEINDKKTEIIEYYDEWVSQKLGSNWAYQTLNLASSNRFPKMVERTNKYFNIMTNGNYNNVEFHENSIEVQSNDSLKFDLNELSTGTMIQLLISLRCAFVMEISDLVKLPILIDDAFNDFDKNRYASAVKLIKSMSEENQIFYVMTNNMSAQDFADDHIIDLGGKNEK